MIISPSTQLNPPTNALDYVYGGIEECLNNLPPLEIIKNFPLHPEEFALWYIEHFTDDVDYQDVHSHPPLFFQEARNVVEGLGERPLHYGMYLMPILVFVMISSQTSEVTQIEIILLPSVDTEELAGELLQKVEALLAEVIPFIYVVY